MKEHSDTYSWRCGCGLEVSVGVVGYGEVDIVKEVSCPICVRYISVYDSRVEHNTVCEEVLSPKEQWKSIAKSLDMANKYGMGTERLKKYINDSPLLSADMAELELRIAAYNMAIHPPVVLTNKGD